MKKLNTPNRRPRWDTVRPVPLPPEPTNHLPGTRDKIETMRTRAARHQAVFHPGDAGMDQFHRVRVPQHAGNFWVIGWDIRGEVEYRRTATFLDDTDEPEEDDDW